MSNKAAIAALSVLLLTGCDQAENRLAGTDEPLAQRIREYMAPLVADGDFTGSIAVTNGNRVLAALAFGQVGPGAETPNTAETRHHIASLSKTLTAMALMLLVDDGLVSPQDPLAQFIPSFPSGDSITLHHLLTHTSGIPDINRFPEYGDLSTKSQTLEDLISVIARASSQAGPGDYAYSNSNYILLAYVIESVSGAAYGDVMAERVFEPLSMSQSAHPGSARDRTLLPTAEGQIPVGLRGVGPAPYLDWSIKIGNGSIVSTVGDLSIFLQRLYDRPLLTESTRDLMLTPHVDGRHAYGWFVSERFGRRVIYMNGNTPGVSASQELYPDERIAVAVLANHDVPLASAISKDIAAMVLGEPVEPPEPLPRYDPDGGIATTDYVGRYEFGVGFDISSEDGILTARGAWPRYPTALVPIAENVFFHRFYRNELRFERGEDGAVIALTWAGRTVQRQVSE